MANEDGSVKIKVNMDITDVGAGVKDIGGQLKRVNVAAGNASETLKSALVNAVDAATGKSVQGQIFSLGSKLAALGPTFQKALAGNKAAVNDFQAKTADIAESISRLWKGLRQLGEAQYASPELDALDVEIDEAERKALELKETFHAMKDAGSTVKNDARFKQIAQEYSQALNHLKELQDKRDEMIKSGEGLLSFKDTAEFQGMAASLDVVNGRLTGMQERLVEAAINAAAARREVEAAAAAEAAAQEEAARQAEAAEAEAQKAAEAAEAQRLDDIAQSAQVSSQAVIRLTQELEQLRARQQELNDAGVGMGYAEYDANAERIRAVTAALREYATTGSDAQARAIAPDQSAWERFRQKILSAAASLGLARRQTDDTSGAMKRLRSGAETAASGMGSMFKRVLKWGLGIGSVTMLVRRLWSAVGDGLNIMAQHDAETADTLNGLKTALTNVKLSLATAFGPVVTAVAPLLIKLGDLVTRAANAVARFFAILSGKSTYKKAVAAQDAITDSVAGTGEAAKEAAKNLSGLDELNTWQENKVGSGGGSGSAGGGAGVDMEEVETGAATDFEVRLKDLLFNWDDLNPELIAEKILTGLCAAAGGIIGWTIGGPLGGLVGLTLGALLGVKLSQVTFDGDGTINPKEAAKMIVTAVCGLIGGVLGATVGGPLGAAIGFTVGAGVSVLIGKSLFNNDGKLNKKGGEKLILAAVSGMLAGILGFVIGGPGGAIIGFSIGAGVSVLIGKALFNNDGKLNKKGGEKLILAAVSGMLAGILGFVIGGPGGAIIGFTLAAGITAKIGDILFESDEKATESKLIDSLVKALTLIIGGATIGFAVGGTLGAAIGMTIGVALTFAVMSTKWKKGDPDVPGPAGNNSANDLYAMQKEAEEAIASGEYVPEIQTEWYPENVTVSVEADIVDVKDCLTDEQKELTVRAVIGKITKSLSEEDSELPMKAILHAVSDDSLPDEFKDLAMDAIVKTVDSTSLEPEQKQLVFQATLDAVDSTELGIDDKSLIMTALIHAVDGTGLTPDDKEILTTAKLDSVIDAIAPQDKEVGGIVGNVGELRAPARRLTLDASARATKIEDDVPKKKKVINKAKVKVQELVDEIPDREKAVGGVFEGTSFTNGMKLSPVVNAVAKGVAWLSGLKSNPVVNAVAKGIEWLNGLKADPVLGVTAKGTAYANGLKSNPVVNAVAKGITWLSGLKANPVQNVTAKGTAYANGLKSNPVIKAVTKGTTFQNGLKSNPVVNAVAKGITWLSGLKANPVQSVTARATSFVDAIRDKTITVKAKISEIVSSAASKVRSWLGLATGGIYKNGRWEPIEGYASGGSPRSARLFYANENGMPELVGRIGSSTAVMNNGQIVASVAAGVYRAVAAVFTRLGGWFSAMTARLGDIPPAIEMLSAMPRQIPQPVMATGTVLPPRAVYADGPVQGLADAVSGLRDALDRQSPDRSGTGREPTYNVNLNVDGQTLCRIVLREGRLRQLQSGGNPFMDLMGG